MCTERVICPWPHTHTHQAGWPFLLVLEQIIFTGRIPVATRWLHQSSRQNSIIPRVFWLNKYISSSTPTNYICPVLTVSINWYIPFSEPSVVFLWWNLVHQSSSSRLDTSVPFLNLIGAIFSAIGDVSIDIEASVVASSISRVYRLSLSNVLIEVGMCVCVRRGECAWVYVSVCVCTIYMMRGNFGIYFFSRYI